jgi:NAD(P)-dependent dehydrogenase (short-subunit alcohol dehydrogenase family)
MKNFLIIGGSSGIGKQLVKILSEQGHRVIATYNTQETISESDLVSYHHLDVTQDELDLGFLPESIHGLAYCPGSIQLLPFRRLKTKDIIEDLELQVNGLVKVLQNAYKVMRKGEASIVLFSTVAVQQGFNFHSLVSISKGAIEGLTRSLAAEFAPHIRVNAIAPSITDTPLAARLLNTDEKKKTSAENHPLKKIGKPDNIAAVASFLLSNDSSWMTGQILHVDGGKSSINS